MEVGCMMVMPDMERAFALMDSIGPEADDRTLAIQLWRREFIKPDSAWAWVRAWRRMRRVAADGT